MGVGQAFAVAFGLVFLIFGGLYILVRTEQAATQQRENPAGPQSKVWLLVHRGIGMSFAGLAVWVGTRFLIHGRPNRFLAAGVAIWLCAFAMKQAFGLAATLRTTFFANMLAGLLCGIGFALQGGRIGILGTVLSLFWSVLHLWLLKMMWRIPNHSAPMPPLTP